MPRTCLWFTALCVIATNLFLEPVDFGQSGGASAASVAVGSNSTTAKLYLVARDNKVGFIDASGKLVIPFRFDHAKPFREGRAYVQFEGRCGYIDAAGDVVFAEKRLCSKVAWSFHEGLAGFEFKTRRTGNSYLHHRKRGYFDTNGRIVIPPSFFNVGDFHEGLAAVCEHLNGKYGYIDRTGQCVISPRFDYASDFSEGMAAVELGKKTGYIDRHGQIVIQPQFDRLFGGEFHEDLAMVGLNGKLGAIDRTGRFVVPPVHGTAWDCSEGLIAFSGGPARARYYDTAGNVVIEGEYDEFRPFSEGLAAVAISYRWGYINRKGQLVLPLQFGRAFEFHGGLAMVYSAAERDWVYIDTKGNVVWRGVPL